MTRKLVILQGDTKSLVSRRAWVMSPETGVMAQAQLASPVAFVSWNPRTGGPNSFRTSHKRSDRTDRLRAGRRFRRASKRGFQAVGTRLLREVK